jgi:hypothetical protein
MASEFGSWELRKKGVQFFSAMGRSAPRMVRTVEWLENGRKIHIVRRQSEIPLIMSKTITGSASWTPSMIILGTSGPEKLPPASNSAGMSKISANVKVSFFHVIVWLSQVGPTLVKELSF